MAGVHALIGLGEALVTVGALTYIRRIRPDLLEGQGQAPAKAWIIPALAVTGAVLLLAPFASAFPDGLERAAEDLGFMSAARDPSFNLLPGYSIPTLGQTPFSTIAAGLAGVFLLLLLFYLVGRKLGGRSRGES
jgi:cobalt/nickel transport system permease protein